MSKLKLAQSVLNLSEVDAWQLFLRELKGCAVPNSSLAATPTPLFPFRFNGVTLHLPARLDDKLWRSAGQAVQSGLLRKVPDGGQMVYQIAEVGQP